MTSTTNDTALHCVLDASVAIKWVMDEAGSEEARSLLGRLATPDTRFHVPSLFFIELANVLWKHTQRRTILPEFARESLAIMHTLPLLTHPVEGLARIALELSLTHGAAAYDMAYIALAEATGLPFITADEKLWQRLRSHFDVRLVREM